MSGVFQSDRLLVERVRAAEPAAWTELIDRFEGRLLAFVESRLRDRAASEDVVQEAFIGFLTSLPSYDSSRPLEGYLFSIAAHKLTDYLRREGRRPTLPLAGAGESSGDWDLPGSARRASSIFQSGERRHLEEGAVAVAMEEQLEHWKQRGDWPKIRCLELLIVHGWPNKQVAAQLELTEQQVANYKFEFIERIRGRLGRAGLSEDIFPELYDADTSEE